MDAILGRREVVIAVVSGVLLACLALTPDSATAAPRKDRLASTIQARLNALGDTTAPMTAAEGYFYRNPILPQRAFYAYAGCRQVYHFTVSVYRTEAQAIAMYNYFYEHTLSIGGDFRAFNMVRRGRVIYTADTASAPDPSAPAVPTAAFHSLVAEVSGPLPSHPHACEPQL